MRLLFLLSILLISSWGCEDHRTSDSLPILGETSVDPSTGSLIYYQAPSFSFIDQLNQGISEEDFEGKVYVVDFFFTSCPTICPQMTNHLKLVQDHFLGEKRLGIISYSIDPKYDTPERLAAYADRYGVDQERWSLLTGYETDVFELAKDYKVSAFDDTMGDERNIIHDGTFVLIDAKRRIRGYYDGLKKAEVKRLIGDIELLLKSM